MLKCKDIISSSKYGYVLVTLKDGRCALVDTNTRCVDIDILLASFDSFGTAEFSSDLPVDKELVYDILKNPKKIKEFYGAKKYLTDEQEKEKWDKLKKEFGYNY